MPRFRYQAIDQHQQPVNGEIDAASLAAAQEHLASQELSQIQLKVVPQRVVGQKPLTPEESDEFTQQLIAVTDADLPLDVGLDAAAREVSSTSLRRVLKSVAARLRQGSSLPQALDSVQPALPPHLRDLIEVAHSSGRISEVLEDLTAFNSRRRGHWRALFLSLAYPLLVLMASIGLLTFVLMTAVPDLKEFMTDFEFEVGPATKLLFSLSDYMAALTTVALAAPLVVLLIRLIAGRTGWRRIVGWIPVYGPTCHWSGVAEFARLMSLLVRYEIPLTSALRLASQTVNDSYVGVWAKRMASRIEGGEPFPRVVQTTAAMPPLMASLAAVATSTDDLAAAMLMTAEVLEGHVEFRINAMRFILPIILFLFVILIFMIVIVGLISPLQLMLMWI